VIDKSEAYRGGGGDSDDNVADSPLDITNIDSSTADTADDDTGDDADIVGAALEPPAFSPAGQLSRKWSREKTI
jgi:hypothetical protein